MEKELIYNDPERVYELLKDLSSKELLDEMGLTSGDIENFCKNNALDCSQKEKDEYTERKIKSPIMAVYFYYFIYIYRKLPNQQEFIQFYLDLNERWVSLSLPGRFLETFKGRMCRFYPSIIRDVHFYHLAKESGEFDRVSFNLKDDLHGKVDVLVEYESKQIGVQLRTKTSGSTYYFEKKKFRDPIEMHIEFFDMPINLNRAKTVYTKKDSLKLYTFAHVRKIKEKMVSNG